MVYNNLLVRHSHVSSKVGAAAGSTSRVHHLIDNLATKVLVAISVLCYMVYSHILCVAAVYVCAGTFLDSIRVEPRDFVREALLVSLALDAGQSVRARDV